MQALGPSKFGPVCQFQALRLLAQNGSTLSPEEHLAFMLCALISFNAPRKHSTIISFVVMLLTEVSVKESDGSGKIRFTLSDALWSLLLSIIRRQSFLRLFVFFFKSKVEKGLLSQMLYLQSQLIDLKNLSGVWKLQRLCQTCIEFIFEFLP